jgi:hypothetical protein
MHSVDDVEVPSTLADQLCEGAGRWGHWNGGRVLIALLTL